jgi:hypothetical protein
MISDTHRKRILGLPGASIFPSPPGVRSGEAKRSKVLGQASRILIAPQQGLPDDFVFARAGETLSKKSLTSFLVDERGKHSLFRGPPSVQLDRKRTLINASLKRWRVPQIFAPTRYTIGATLESLGLGALAPRFLPFGLCCIRPSRKSHLCQRTSIRLVGTGTPSFSASERQRNEQLRETRHYRVG